MLETLIQQAFNHFQKAKNSNQTRTKKRTTKKRKNRFGYWFGNGSGMFDKTRLANVDIKVFVKAVLLVRVFFNCCTKKIHTVFCYEKQQHNNYTSSEKSEKNML